jgi:hypothetical protein
MLSSDLKAALDAEIYTNKPSLWAKDLFGLDLDGWQKEMLDSPAKRIILNIHRQGGKSTISSLLVLHVALFKPGSLSLIIAPALRQSQENFKKVRGFIDQLPSCPDFDESTKLSLQFENGSRILSLPGGSEGATIRGFSRPDVIVEDEASRCSDSLYQALRPMMATNSGCKLILCSTPWGQRGHFYKIWTEGEAWLKLKVIASECKRISHAFLEEERKALGPWVFAQEYEGEFVGDESQLFTLSMIKNAHNTEIPIISLGCV